MDNRLLLFAIVMGGTIAIHLLAAAFFRWKKARARKMHVLAKVNQIQIWIEGWYIVAVWTDRQTGQHYIFRSPCIELNLKQRIGDFVRVDFNIDNPNHYRMKL